MQSRIFSIVTPVFSVAWSLEIILIYWFAAQETFLIIISVKNSPALYFLWETKLIEGSKEQHLIETEIFCNIIYL